MVNFVLIQMVSIHIQMTVKNTTNVLMEHLMSILVHLVFCGMISQNIVTGLQMFNAIFSQVVLLHPQQQQDKQ